MRTACQPLVRMSMSMSALQVSDSSYPAAPSNMKELFAWREHNAKVLMGLPQLRQNFIRLLGSCDRICVHEDYAGIGTAGVTLVQQFVEFKNMVEGDLPASILPLLRLAFVRFNLRHMAKEPSSGAGICL